MTSKALELNSPQSTAVVIPEEGGRIQHLVDHSSGRELLLQRTPAGGLREDFLDSCAGGWDELFPNDSAWHDYPDHGRVWTQPFEVRNHYETVLVMTASISSPNVEVTRRISLLEGPHRGVRSEVTLSAVTATGPFLWAAHPMLGVQEGWRIELPSAATTIEADTELSGRLEPGRILTRAEWELASEIPAISSAVGEVVYVDGVGEAVVRSKDGRAATRVSWDTSFYKHLWLVVITGAYGLEDCLLIEPCTTRPFRLEEAIPAGSTRSLERGEEVSWWVEVESLDRQDGVQ